MPQVQEYLTLARLSDACYEGGDDLAQFGPDEMVAFYVHPSAAYCMRFDKRLVLVFRGTNDTQDMINNLMVGATKGIHRGVWYLFLDLWRDIRRFLNEHRDCWGDIEVAGHSLGGALARLCVRELVKDGFPPPTKAAAFGAPSIIKNGYGNHIVERYLASFVHGNDIVPRLLNWRYARAHRQVTLRPFSWWRLWAFLYDHNMGRYIEWMEEHQNQEVPA